MSNEFNVEWTLYVKPILDQMNFMSNESYVKQNYMSNDMWNFSLIKFMSNVFHIKLY